MKKGKRNTTQIDARAVYREKINNAQGWIVHYDYGTMVNRTKFFASKVDATAFVAELQTNPQASNFEIVPLVPEPPRRPKDKPSGNKLK